LQYSSKNFVNVTYIKPLPWFGSHVKLYPPSDGHCGGGGGGGGGCDGGDDNLHYCPITGATKVIPT